MLIYIQTYLHELPKRPDDVVKNFPLHLEEEAATDTNQPQTTKELQKLENLGLTEI